MLNSRSRSDSIALAAASLMTPSGVGISSAAKQSGTLRGLTQQLRAGALAQFVRRRHDIPPHAAARR